MALWDLKDRVRKVLSSRVSKLARADEVVRASTYPPPYPDGWYKVANSRDIRRGEAHFVECLGEQFVVFRSDVDGTVAVLDAYCPHLGANLAMGRVTDGSLECPFHKWTFSQCGSVEKIPYSSERIPKSLRTRSWPVNEVHGMILMYFSTGRAGKGQPIEPPYAIAPIEDITSGKMVPRGKHDAGEVSMHLIEFAENSVDFAHFDPLHGQMLVPWTQIRVPFAHLDYEASWDVDVENEHMAYFSTHAVLKLFGRELKDADADALITFYGPAGVVTFRFTIPKLGEILMFQTHTPLEPLRQQVDFTWFAEPSVPRPLVSYVVGSWISQWRADVEIWENKVYRSKPMLVSNDGPIHKLRKWYQQFYPHETLRSPAENRISA